MALMHAFVLANMCVAGVDANARFLSTVMCAVAVAGLRHLSM